MPGVPHPWRSIIATWVGCKPPNLPQNPHLLSPVLPRPLTRYPVPQRSPSRPTMPFISLTRLRIRSFRLMPFFVWHTLRSLRQVRSSPGFQTGALLPDRSFTFWTLTAWDTPESMRGYLISGAHKAAMPHLLHWCDEASVAHWTQPEPNLPSWTEADRRMRSEGRPSKVSHPSPHHADLTYPAPRTTGGAPICPTGKPPTP